MSGSKSSAPAASPDVGGDTPIDLTVHHLPELTQAATRQTRAGRWKMLAVMLVCAAPVVASYFTYFVIRPGGRTNYGELIQPSRTMPELKLQDVITGATTSTAALKGQWLMVAVGPAACDAACENRLYVQRQLREMMGKDRDRVERVWLITDGAAPRPELQAALQQTKGLHLLRADGAAVAAWLQPAAGQALEDHLYLVDPMGEWMMRVPPQPDPKKFKADLERLLKASASWQQNRRKP